MKPTILINQQTIIQNNLGLSIYDAIILEALFLIKNHPKTKIETHDNIVYFQMEYDDIVTLFPILKITDDALNKRLFTLKNKGFIHFGLSKNYYSLSNLGLSLFIHTESEHFIKPNKRQANTNKDLFIDIKNIEITLSTITIDKTIFYVAYLFWKLWIKHFPKSYTLKRAKIHEWYNALRLIIEQDQQDINRLIGIYLYFKFSALGENGFNDFWFNEIQSVKALRKNTSNDEYRIDKIIRLVNAQLNTNNKFSLEFDKLTTSINTNPKLK